MHLQFLYSHKALCLRIHLSFQNRSIYSSSDLPVTASTHRSPVMISPAPHVMPRVTELADADAIVASCQPWFQSSQVVSSVAQHTYKMHTHKHSASKQ